MKSSIEDCLYSQWARIGVGFDVDPAQVTVSAESLLARTCSAASDSPRLFWAAASWLAIHHQLVNGRLLAKELKTLENQFSAVAGAILSVAIELNPTASTLDQAISHCSPLKGKRVLFAQYAINPILTEYARRESFELFERWGFWHNQISDKRDAIRPVSWIIKACPDLRIRSILGASLDAEIMHQVLLQPLSATALKNRLPYTYASIHEAASRLCDRGLLKKRAQGRALVLHVPSNIEKWLDKISA